MAFVLEELWYHFLNIGTMGMQILILGPAGAGKTTTLRKLNLGQIVNTTLADGFSVETVEYKNINFTAFGIGAQNESSCKDYFQNTGGLIYVVDSSDADRIEESRDELTKLLNADELGDVAVIVFANKQDLPNAMKREEITAKLNLENQLQGHQWFIQATSATNGDGLYEGLDWLAEELSKKKK